MRYGTLLRGIRHPEFVVMVVEHPANNNGFISPQHPEHFAVVAVLAPHPRHKSGYGHRPGWGDEGHVARLQLYTYEHTDDGEPQYEEIA